MTLRIYSEIKTGSDGKEYGLRHLLSREELDGLKRAGLVGEVEDGPTMSSRRRSADSCACFSERVRAKGGRAAEGAGLVGLDFSFT